MKKALVRILISALQIFLTGCNEDVAGLKPSGLNNSFNLPPDTSFQTYIDHYKKVVETSRIDLEGPDRKAIIAANIPFELRPSGNIKPSRGILLIHGLFDSPYHMKSLGRYFQRKGFLVRGILLPGHGTIPGDQLEVKSNDWLRATDYGVNSLRNEVDTVFIGGFSTGGSLALHYALENPGEIEALFLFSPCLKVNSKLAWLTTLFSNFKDWLITRKNYDYARYESFAVNSASQVYDLTKKINAIIPEKDLAIPVFAVLSQDDITVNSNHTIDLFKKITSPSSRLLIYTGAQSADSYNDRRVSTIDVSDPSKNIISSSHTAIIIPPDDDHYGEDGGYRNCLHYFFSSNQIEKCRTGKNILYEEVTNDNLSQGTLRRLTWNPKFDEMLENMSGFLESLEEQKSSVVE